MLTAFFNVRLLLLFKRGQKECKRARNVFDHLSNGDHAPPQLGGCKPGRCYANVHGMEWNAIHHDLHLSVLAGVWRVFAVVLAAPHPTAHRVLHLGEGRTMREKNAKER